VLRLRTDGTLAMHYRISNITLSLTAAPSQLQNDLTELIDMRRHLNYRNDYLEESYI
jgi:hypothetical protein